MGELTSKFRVCSKEATSVVFILPNTHEQAVKARAQIEQGVPRIG